MEEIDEPPPPLSNAPDKRASSIENLCEWTGLYLIGSDNLVHQRCFDLGRWGAAFFSEWLDESERREFLCAHADVLVDVLRNILMLVLPTLQTLDIESERTPELRAFLCRIGINSAEGLTAEFLQNHSISASDLLSALLDHGASWLDEVVPAVFHTVGELPKMELDWGEMKESVRGIFESGCRWPAIMLSANGRYGVGMVDEQFKSLLAPVQDPNKEVYFFNQNGLS